MGDIRGSRIRHEGVNRNVVEIHAQHVTHERAVFKEHRVVHECRKDRAAIALRRRQGLGQEQNQPKNNERNDSDSPESPAPTTGHHEETTHERAKNRGERHNQHKRGEHLSGTRPLVEVTHNGAGQHRAGAGAYGLQNTGDDELRHGICHSAPCGTESENNHACSQRNLTAHAVAHRAQNQLSQRETQQEAGNHKFFAGAEFRGDFGNARQENVRREGRAGHESAERNVQQKGALRPVVIGVNRVRLCYAPRG